MDRLHVLMALYTCVEPDVEYSGADSYDDYGDDDDDYDYY